MSHPIPPQPSGISEVQRRRRTVVAVVLGVVGVLAVVLAGTAVALATGGDPGEGGGTAVAGAPATAEPTATEPSPTEPEPTTEAPEPTQAAEPADPPADGRLSAAEYTEDWDFRLGDVELQADHVRGVDHRTCAPVARGGTLGELGCRYAVEVTYDALDGRLRLTHLFLALPSAKSAEKAIAQDRISDADFRLRDQGFVPDYALGKYRGSSGSNFVVLTVATAEAGVNEKQLTRHLGYANTDFSSALMFRF